MMHACHFTLSKFSHSGDVAASRSLNLRFSLKCSCWQVHVANNHRSDGRGALSVLEGLDQSGKTSQSGSLHFSSAKGLDIEWCKAREVGLLAPDLVVYLDISPEKAAEGGGYVGERYEQLEFQKSVVQCYKKLSDASWKTVYACLPMEVIEKQLKEIVLDCVKTCQKGKSPSQPWSS